MLNHRRFTFERLEARRVLSAVSIPVDVTAEPSGQVVVPVEISDSEDVRGVEIEISYDTDLLDADDDSVTAGAVWEDAGADVVVNVDDDAGTIVAWVSAAAGLESLSGSLLDIEFTVSSDAVVGETTDIDLVEVIINEEEIAVDPEPEAGADTTDGLITFVEADDSDDDSDDDDDDDDGEGDIAEADSLSGYVYIDRDGDGIRDSGESGVPGVQITLTGIDTSGAAVTLRAFTDGNGSYSFTDLAPGTYQLAERQPVAMSDGQDSTNAPGAMVADDNIANIVLEGGEFHTKNNFGEAGLFPEYISIRMFFASAPSPEECLLDTIVFAEEYAGNVDLADAIRNGDISFAEANTAPAANDDTYSVVAGNVLTVDVGAGVLTNDADTDGDSLIATIVDSPTNGSLTLNSDGSFVYTPNDDFVGSEAFTYRAYDGQLYSNTATATITVAEQNTAPNAASDTYSVNEDATLNIGASTGVLMNDGDADGDLLTATLVSTPANGTVTLDSAGSFTYTPDANFHGVDSFTYLASDGSADSDVTTVTITVASVNDTPVASSDAYLIDEDDTLSIDSESGLLANDSDSDGDMLAATLLSTPASGEVVLDTDGSFSYTPDTNFYGTDSFTYRAHDGEAHSAVTTVTITVVSINDAPAAADDSYTVDEDDTLSIDSDSGVLANDADADGDDLTANVVSSPSHGTLSLSADGSFTYVPNTGYSGTDSFTYEANDGASDSSQATVTIAVVDVNHAPAGVDDTYSMDEDTVLAVDAIFGVLGNDTDTDGDTLTATLVDLPAHGDITLNSDGSFTYTPEIDFAGSDSFTYAVSDGFSDSDLATVSLSVADVDDPAAIVLPIEFIDSANVAQRPVGETIEFTVKAEDIDDETPVFQLDLESSGIPDGAALPTIDSSSGEFQWTPTATGEFEIRVIVINEDGEANQESFPLEVISGD